MRDWSLGPGDPLYLTIAADARLCNPDYLDDHIWELEIGSGEPPAISLRTTYGLRARSMRLFLRFGEDGEIVSDPAVFVEPPRLRRFFPNFLALDMSPLENLKVRTEYWIPESQAAAGRVSLTNEAATPRTISLEIAGALVPLEGQSLTPVQQQMVNVLAGQTGGLFPVVFMTGGPKAGPGPHPSLVLDIELGPGATRQLTFAQAARDTLKDSFELARHTAARPWEAERARIELFDTSDVIDIETGDAEWDAALAFSQRAAFGLFFNGNGHLRNPSYVWARQPDHGYSRKGDGSDYPPAWSGQTPLETHYITSLMPGGADLARGLLENFLLVQEVSGQIDHKPGLAGQRGKLAAAPILASLAWQIFQVDEDEGFLAEIYPKLQDFFRNWTSFEHDQDHNGLPEWDHPLQTGFEDNPLFDVWHPWSQGVEIKYVDTPEIAAMLCREAESLRLMAEKLGKTDEAELLQSAVTALRAKLEQGWDEASAMYKYRDREAGRTQAGELVIESVGDGNLKPKAAFKHPVRLQIEVQTENPGAKRPEVGIGELSTKGELETIAPHDFRWRSGGLVATSRKVYRKVGRVQVSGLEADDKIVIRSADLSAEDHTLLLPLWSRVPSPERVEQLIDGALEDTKRFDCPYGIPAAPTLGEPEAEAVGMSVHLPWNQLVGEGLVAYGLREEAARLTGRLMQATILSLKQTRAFYQRYHAGRGTGIGERNALNGFAPVGLFLQVLGVTILSDRRVRLAGRNPFPWPVTLKYKGLRVVRGLEETVITLPSGAETTVTTQDELIVSE